MISDSKYLQHKKNSGKHLCDSYELLYETHNILVAMVYLISEKRFSQLYKGDRGNLSRYWITRRVLPVS